MSVKKNESIADYVKSLQSKIRQLQLLLQQRNAEILRLQNQLRKYADSTGDAPLEKRDENPIQAAILDAPPEETLLKKGGRPGEDAAYGLTKKKEPPAAPVKKVEKKKNEEKKGEETGRSASRMNGREGAFLNAVLEGEEEAEEIRSLLERLESSERDQRRSIFMSLTSVYWRLTGHMAGRLPKDHLCLEKRLCMRYGMLDEKLMAGRMDVWEALQEDDGKPGDSGVYYVDEWFEAVYRGEFRYSTIDEFALDGAKPDPHAQGEKALSYEIITALQMQRMCVGPRANLAAVLVQDYCAPGRDNPIINRAWAVKNAAQAQSCDFTIFQRRYRGEDRVVKPLILICPGYGQRSGCWEPYTPGRKGDSGPRIPLCAFPPRSSMKALLLGLSDYRWEYAKADAMHYWLTEGLTGKWLALFNKKEQRKDLKALFQESYLHWIINESRRIPKLEKRIRHFFWQNCPFSDTVKESLRGGGVFGRLLELDEAKKRREEAERQEIERIKAEREARRAKRKSQMSGI